jgi:hypothetical protein
MPGLFKSHHGAGKQECLISVLLFYFLQFYKLAKKMKKLLIIAVTFISCSFSLFGQGDLNEQQKVFFRNERSFAIVLNTDGYGFSYRAANRINYLNKRLFEIEGGSFKHPKEYKQPTLYNQGGSFKYGKINSPFYFRVGLGHQHEIFKKADLGGIAIRYFYSAGPVLGIYKPIYYKIVYPLPGNEYYIKEEKFKPAITQPQDIYSRASFFKGFNEIRLTAGLFAKGGFNFEYSKEDKIIHAIEIGAQINAFPNTIPIMASSDNKNIFFSLFVSYRFGMILDPLDPESNKISNIFRRKKNN